MENKKITPPEGYKFEVISDTEIKLVPVETKPKYPNDISKISRNWKIEDDFHVEQWDDNWNHCSSKETALKFAAMMQLIEFRDAWNKIDGFVADWNNDSQVKWCILINKNKITVFQLWNSSSPLHFGSKETAELFLNTHRALIEQAGDLV